MKNPKFLNLLLLPILAITISSCGDRISDISSDKNEDNSTNVDISSEESSYSEREWSQEDWDSLGKIMKYFEEGYDWLVLTCY